jgi:rubrerythrin
MREQIEALKHKVAEEKEREPSEEKFERDMEQTAIDTEVMSIGLYERLLENCDDEAERKIYEEIIADEKDHEEKMKKIKAKV